MVNDKVKSKNDFLWLSQMRFYWQEDNQRFWEPRGINDNMWTQMVAARKAYGYEYLGNSFRLVITPLTDKCYLTLMGALQMLRGGAPAGPAGTGKTETVKDLAKALAKQCVVFNCGDGLIIKLWRSSSKVLQAVGRGPVSWVQSHQYWCLVWLHQIIFLAWQRMNAETIEFEGSTIRLGQHLLPTLLWIQDMLAVWTSWESSCLLSPRCNDGSRLCPYWWSYLYAFGFSKARICGQKMVTTFTLCSEQLSLQKHYDYGMRAVETVIVAAGNLKRKNQRLKNFNYFCSSTGC